MSNVECLDRFRQLIGPTVTGEFENAILSVVDKIPSELQGTKVDNTMIVDYATQVFATMLDRLAENLEEPVLLN